jgi:hypothetical protein
MTISRYRNHIAILAMCSVLVACGSSGAGGSGQPTELRQAAATSSPPVISGEPPAVATVGQEYLFEPSGYDPDGDTLTFSITNRPEWATFSPITGRFRGTPTATSAPVYEDIQISVTDGSQTASLPAFKLTVDFGPQAPQNSPPTISGTPPTTVVTGNAYEFLPAASDPDGDVLAFSIANKPSWAQFDDVTGRLSGTPGASQVGTFAGVTISVTDGSAEASLPAFSITVTAGSSPGPGNQPPSISGTPAGAVTVGQSYVFRPEASDPDGQALTFSIQNAPTWASFDTATGELSGTPGVAHVGQATNIVISASDGQASASLPAFSITVLAANSPPQISGVPTPRIVVGEAYDFRPTASDPDGQTLAFSILNKPSWASFSRSTGRLSGTPATGDVGAHSNVSISVTDGAAVATLPTFSIVVEAPNRAPVISGSPATSATTDQTYTFTPTASDPDGDALTFTVANKPSWASFNGTNGRLSGVPGSSFAGLTFSGITITVSDGEAQTALPPFSIAVQSANRTPTISGSAATTATTGQAYSFQPAASDPDGDKLTFSIAGKPAWANFDAASGRLSGTPGSTGTFSGITISVSDGSLSASLAPFTITVQGANRSPTISGTPTTSVTVGQSYSFQPTASDPDGDALSYSIANKPDWAAFNGSTGRLSGSPTSGDVGTYSGITITVSDGTASSALPAFSITVADAQTGSATLSWSAPTLNEDGSPLTNLKGYRIYYGTSSTNLGNVLEVPTPGTTTAVVENLSPATWYFALKAYNTSNVESGFSNVASKTIR